MPATVRPPDELRELLRDDRVDGLGPLKQAVFDEFRAAVASQVAAYSAAEPDDVEMVGRVRQMRYLRAFYYDVPQAAEKYSATLEWRLEGRVAQIRHQAVLPGYVPPHWEVINRYWQIRPLFCYDATGSPVMVESIGRSNLRALLTESGLHKAQLLAFWTHMMEWQILLLDRLSAARGELVRKAEIRDLDGLGMAHTYGPGIEFFKACAAITSRHYVEIVRVVIIVNAPWVFDSIYKLLAGAVPEATKAKIKVLSASSKLAAATLDEHIGLHKLPGQYGGSNGAAAMHWQVDSPCELLGGHDGSLASLLPPPALPGASRQASAPARTPSPACAHATLRHASSAGLADGALASLESAASAPGRPPIGAGWLRGSAPARESSRTPLAPEASDAGARQSLSVPGIGSLGRAGAGGGHGARAHAARQASASDGGDGGGGAPRGGATLGALGGAKVRVGAGGSRTGSREPLREVRSSSIDEGTGLQPDGSRRGACCCLPWLRRRWPGAPALSRGASSSSATGMRRGSSALASVPEHEHHRSVRLEQRV